MRKQENMNKVILSIIVGFLLFVIGLIVGIGIFNIYMRYHKKETITYLEYGDNFSDYMATDMQQNSIRLNKKGINIYFYLSQSCDSCLDILELYKELSKVKYSEDVEFFCLWENDIPEEKIKKMKLEADNVLSLQDKYKFSSVKPYFFVVKDGKVDFLTQNYAELVDRVLYYNDVNKIKEDVFINQFGSEDMSNKALIFVTDETSNINIENLGFTKCLMIANYRNEDIYYDKYDVYRKIFGIDEYPTTVSWNGHSFDNTVIENSY